MARRVTVGGLFDGCGLLAYGLHLAGLEHRWLCELVPFRRELLEQRFGVPVYPDVRAVGADAPQVDVIAGGFPCKGVSGAGKREGFGHPETALWREMRRIIGDLRPRYVLVENVADLLALHDGALFGEVLGDLAALGYDAEWDCFPAAAFGAPHRRDRVFVTAVADPERGVHRRPGRGDLPGTTGAGEGEGPQRQRVRADAANGSRAAADSGGGGRRGQSEREDGGSERLAQAERGEGHEDARHDRATAADANGGRRAERDAEGWGVPEPHADCIVDWGEFEQAIRQMGSVCRPGA
jgi:DNA (cytosine-5)-methyltransferase 1